MTDAETLEERVRTVERAVTDGDHEFPEATDLAELRARVESVEQRLTELDDRTAELEAATQALRGYVGNVRSVNQDVEQRADAALAAVEELERRFGDQRPDSAAETSPATYATGPTPSETSAPAETPAPAQTATRDTHDARGTATAETGPPRHSSPNSDADSLAESARTDDSRADSQQSPGVIERIRSVL